MNPTIWVVVPLGRATMLPNVVGNFERQRYPHKKLVVVENGAGLGACRKHGFQPDLVLDSDAHQSAAKNVALETLIDMGARYWATMDDDDYYGPAYLEGIADGFRRGFEVVGKASIFLRFSDGRMHLLEQAGELKEVPQVNGPTISSVVRQDMPRFPVMGWGEDNAWLEAAREKGWRIWAADHFAFCYCRHGQAHPHTYPITDEGLENMSRALDPVYDCGQFSEHVVNGVEAPARFDRLAETELDMRHHPAVQHWEQQGVKTPWQT